jgi:luciferase family oxidoreductase group 1
MRDEFRDHLEELLRYLDNRMPEEHRFARLARTLPGRPERPEPWLLGSSEQSAFWAAELGLPYAFADFINPHGGPQFCGRYRDTFEPSPAQGQPRVAVALWVVCAETDAEARRLVSSFEMMMTLMYRGQLIPVPSPETAQAFLAAEGGANVRGLPLAQARRVIAGTPDTVKPEIERVAAEYCAGEVFAVNILYDHAARRRSYELLAQAFGIRSRKTPNAETTAVPTTALREQTKPSPQRSGGTDRT